MFSKIKDLWQELIFWISYKRKQRKLKKKDPFIYK